MFPSLPHPMCSQASFTGGGWPWAEGTGQAARKSEFYSWLSYRFPWARQLTLWSTLSMEVGPSFSFCIHNIFNGENGIVGARMSACTFLYLIHFLCQVFGCTAAYNCASKKPLEFKHCRRKNVSWCCCKQPQCSVSSFVKWSARPIKSKHTAKRKTDF